MSLNADDGTPCDDGLFCDGSDACQSGTCTGSGDPCTGPDGDSDCAESCDEAADDCTAPDPDGTNCDTDGLFCTGMDQCQSGACVSPGGPCPGPDGDADCRESCSEATDSCTAPDPDSESCAGGQFAGRRFLFEASATLDDDLLNYSAGDEFLVTAIFSEPETAISAEDAMAAYNPGTVGILVNNVPVDSVDDPILLYENAGTASFTACVFPDGNNADFCLYVALSGTPPPLESFLDLYPMDADSAQVNLSTIDVNEDGVAPTTTSGVFWAITPLPSAGAVPDGRLVAGAPLTVTYSAIPGDLDLSWGSSCLATDLDYAVYEGALGDFTSHVPVSGCSTGGTTSLTLTPGGGGRYYVVVPQSSAGGCEGSYGLQSDGIARSQSPVACAFQAVETCPTKTVFVTSTRSAGDLGGLAGADATCQSLADAAGLTGTYKAWLSDSTASAASRLAHATIPYARTDGVIIADDWADLVDDPATDPLLATISLDENGDTVGTAATWTGSTYSGGYFAEACSDWSDGTDASSGRWGRAVLTNLGWASYGTAACDTSRRLYCFEQ
ncbi:MAG: hypothetical protein PVF68_08030 [Acidobacteriota bacterium]